MVRKSRHVTDAEFAVLETLWERGPLTVRELADVVYPRGNKSHYATVKKLLERMEAKRCVRRSRRTAAHVYEAAVAREDLLGDRLQVMADKLCEGSLTPVLMHLVKSQRLSSSELEMLRALIDEQESASG